MSDYFQRRPLDPEVEAYLRHNQGVEFRQLMRTVRDAAKGREFAEGVDPREVAYQYARKRELLDQVPTTTPSPFREDAARVAGKAIGVPLDALAYLFGGTSRARDQVIGAAMEAGAGSPARAIGALVAAPVSMLYPPAGRFGAGQANDWRNSARDLGVSEGNIMAIDFGTDPALYSPSSLVKYGPIGAAQLGRRVLNTARYGAGKPAYLIDAYGDTIRRLRAD